MLLVSPVITRIRRSLTLRAVVLVVLAIAATTLFVKVAEEMVEGEMDQVDRAIELAIHGIDTPALDDVMVTITWIGSGVTLGFVVGAVALWCLYTDRRRIAFVLSINAIATWGLNELLKHLFARPRPMLFDEITHPKSWSFPSGHSMESMAVYGSIALVIGTLYPRVRIPVVVFASLLILSIGFSRVYLGVHWPSDVVAGFAAGIPLVIVSVHLARVATGKVATP